MCVYREVVCVAVTCVDYVEVVCVCGGCMCVESYVNV